MNVLFSVLNKTEKFRYEVTFRFTFVWSMVMSLFVQIMTMISLLFIFVQLIVLGIAYLEEYVFNNKDSIFYKIIKKFECED
jgi:hypothetical protein